ncbi:aminotransferase class IV [Streptomyces sp. NPDC090077]|uniref:aminotransferase class IV n=1 Tax=Streptomyces sp. NPDC090077 TaxID=3365938 RepID=UPI003813882F
MTERLYGMGISGALLELPPARGAVPVAADSWLVRDGRARALHRHRERFTAAVAEAGGPDVGVFWEEAMARIPATGEWFPRVELADSAGDLRLRIRVRPAPARTTEVRVWVPGRPDPRRTPRRKGPDLGELARLRTEAAAAGADEALLTGADGLVLEGAASSLLWWEDDTLCIVDPDLPVLPGVTRDWALARAAELGVPVRRRRVRPAELAGLEVWCVNALHGIRPVTGWAGEHAPVTPADAAASGGPSERAGAWRDAWERAATPIPVPSYADAPGSR